MNTAEMVLLPSAAFLMLVALAGKLKCSASSLANDYCCAFNCSLAVLFVPSKYIWNLDLGASFLSVESKIRYFGHQKVFQAKLEPIKFFINQ